jgi:23S rRNA (pseudouridine1915-N3)-methyltransferase
MRVKILWVGRTKNGSVRALSDDYLGRLARFLACEVLEARDVARVRGVRGPDLIAAEADEIEKLLPAGCRLVALDERGDEMSSPEFARWLDSEMSRGARELVFVIGGAEGLSPRILGRAQRRLSLGRMTWTHEMCRALLLEQLYRAACILRHVPYHR